MWEQIRANKRKSVILVMTMALLLVALGFCIGLAVTPAELLEGSAPGFGSLNYLGGVFGAAVAGVIWLCMSLTAYFSGARILLAASGARPIEKQDHPQLYNVVEEMCIASGLSKVPRVYIIDDPALNAFAAGRDPNNAAVAVTVGLLARLDRDELQGVIAHEISHVINRDVLFMTMLGVMVGSIVMIADIFLRGMFHSGGHRRRSRYSGSRKGGGNQAQAIMMVVALALAILAPILAYVIYFAASRRREYLADAGAAMLTRYPEGLASALETISGDPRPLVTANKATAPMYIDNPTKKRAFAGLGATHPSAQERIRILRSIGGACSFGAYQTAWKQVGGKRAGALPASAVSDRKNVPVRAPHPEAAKKKNTRQQARDAADLLRKANQFLFLSCLCGLRIKLPPDFKKDQVACPRCHKDVAVPVAQLVALGQIADAIDTAVPEAKSQSSEATAATAPKDLPPLEISRHGQAWQSFKCSCGHSHSLSPLFAGNHMDCRKCGRKILVRGK